MTLNNLTFKMCFGKMCTGHLVLALAMALVVSVANAQTPLDMRVMSERLDQLERQLRDIQGRTSPNMQMPLAPSETGTVT